MDVTNTNMIADFGSKGFYLNHTFLISWLNIGFRRFIYFAFLKIFYTLVFN